MLQKKKDANLEPSLVTEAVSSIEDVFDKTLGVIEENHAQICNIYETICEEVGHKAVELKETKAELAQVIDLVDKQEIETQKKKQELASVTKEYVGFDEQIAYEKVKQFINELKDLREKENHLKNKRDSLERQLRNLIDSQEQAQRLTASISTVNSFLTKQASVFSKESHEDKDDSVEERLTNILYRLTVCERRFDENQTESVKQEIQTLKGQVSECLGRVRQSIFDVSHPTPNGGGLGRSNSFNKP